MKFKHLVLYFTAVIMSAAASAACDSSAVNTNVNANVQANANTAVLTNTNAVATPRDDSNVTREEYDRNRADYERDRGDSKIGQGANDSWLWFKTKAALATADDLRDSTINVDVENDVITLRGSVASAAQKAQAEKVAQGIEGQKGVRNNLQVRPDDSLSNQMTGSNSNSNSR
ncbi:MAG TPA: BON domain-containing protein [Pyrinomonadaceae bacterium]|nr:BON domain-containing protein [Pyrinomonadaceae bacterium]